MDQRELEKGSEWGKKNRGKRNIFVECLEETRDLTVGMKITMKRPKVDEINFL